MGMQLFRLHNAFLVTKCWGEILGDGSLHYILPVSQMHRWSFQNAGLGPFHTMLSLIV